MYDLLVSHLSSDFSRLQLLYQERVKSVYAKLNTDDPVEAIIANTDDAMFRSLRNSSERLYAGHIILAQAKQINETEGTSLEKLSQLRKWLADFLMRPYIDHGPEFRTVFVIAIDLVDDMMDQ
jgi:hypothetical protein